MKPNKGKKDLKISQELKDRFMNERVPEIRERIELNRIWREKSKRA